MPPAVSLGDDPRMSEHACDAVVVGGGPNGLTAAVTLAQAGQRVRLIEAHETVGGGTRSAELLEPGTLHDICSAVQPMARSSPVFASLGLERHGLEWVEPEIQLAHPFDDGGAALVFRDIGRTTETFGDQHDARAYARWIRPVVADWPLIARTLLGPIRPVATLRHPIAFARFGLPALLPIGVVARRFRSPRARALLAGCGAHSFLPLDAPMTSAIGLSLLVSAHAVGWPLARGGSRRIGEALAAVLRELGGEIEVGRRVRSLDELPPHRAALLDLSPDGVLEVAGGRLPGRYAARLRRYRYGPAAFKLDFVCDAPIPWTDPDVGRAGTVHLGGTYEEVDASERAVAEGRVHERPFVLLTQPTQQDASRSTTGRHVVWAYCHVPNGWADAEGPAVAIERQIERFAPGFGAHVVARKVTTPGDLEAYDPNYVGGDINGGLQDWAQTFTRPAPRLDPYSTPDPAIFICSASTPPGGGVHGLCGWWAARSALRGVLH